MAHKTAFTADTLGQHLLQTGFPCAIIARDAMLGLHAVAFATPCELGAAKSVAQTLQPHAEHLIEVQNYGFSAG